MVANHFAPFPPPGGYFTKARDILATRTSLLDGQVTIGAQLQCASDRPTPTTARPALADARA